MGSLGERNYKTVARFALIGDARVNVRAMSRDEFGLGPSARAGDREKQAAFIDARGTAVARSKRLQAEGAEARAARLPKLMPKTGATWRFAPLS
eukprot:4073118-Alexandrium_andersonii.AAC.1